MTSFLAGAIAGGVCGVLVTLIFVFMVLPYFRIRRPVPMDTSLQALRKIR